MTLYVGGTDGVLFDYDPRLRELYVGTMDEMGGMVESVSSEAWDELVRVVKAGRSALEGEN